MCANYAEEDPPEFSGSDRKLSTGHTVEIQEDIRIVASPNKKSIHGEFFTHLFCGRDDISQLQVHQTSVNRLVVRYVATGPSAHEFMARIPALICTWMGRKTKVCIESCNAIPLPPSGKYRFTSSDVPFCSLRSNSTDSWKT
jgi:hypothetical protein